MAPVKSWLVGLLLVLLCPAQPLISGALGAEEGHTEKLHAETAGDDDDDDGDGEGGEGADEQDTGEDESASDKHAFRPGSLCSICTICEHCSSTCAQCPCEDGDQSDHCERCDECSSCYLCPILCDTVCTAGGVVDELSGSLFQVVASLL
uniref:Sarcoplasmic reticulum histidine-rich calcium-binding protein n=1 Tax=Takifugu rubripes TaxID=31033 RepID=A0A674MGT1_TAKRU